MRRELWVAVAALAVLRCGARGDLAGASGDEQGAGGSPAAGGADVLGGHAGSGGSSGGGAAGSGGQWGGSPALDASIADGPGSDATGAGGKKLKLPVSDAAPPADAGGPGFKVVDGGHDCELEDIGAVFAYQSCCNGKLCRGQCVLFDGQAAPVCYCASLVGGCPAPHHCCMGTHCGWSDYCT
ncbi:MAG: hypothetical protein HYZ29_10350 [Myxococcales bacterium]|nr:hypothetical protein [Myxococcales bacterium]